jgi:hypothetical protein
VDGGIYVPLVWLGVGGWVGGWIKGKKRLT